MTWPVILTIIGMSLVTYAARGGGWLIGDRLPRTGRTAAALQAVPGGVLIGIIIPGAFFQTGIEMAAAVAVVAVTWSTRNLIAAMTVGVLVVWVLRQF